MILIDLIILCNLKRANLNYVLRRFIFDSNRQNCEVYLVGDQTRMTLLGAGKTEISVAEDISQFSIGITAVGDRLAKVETMGCVH